MAVRGAVRLDVGHRGQRAVLEILEQIGDVTHMVGPYRRIVRLILKRVADGAIDKAERTAGYGSIVAATIILPRDFLRAQEIADAGHGDRRNGTCPAWRACRRKGRPYVHRGVIVAVIAFRLQRGGKPAELIRDWLDPRLVGIGAIAPLLPPRVLVERTGHRIGRLGGASRRRPRA